ncbi:hypothetical protein [Aquirhabdus sp.]|uniref:hypothetical protein n=1 Tax=Aquirhabdus sp. TaxID=2824160 RepID=UPI00396CDF5B
MKLLNHQMLTLVAVMSLATQSVFAHDPAEHAREAAEAKAGAKCDAMPKKMDPKDPVMLAMMQKCAAVASSATNKPAMDHGNMKGMDMKGMKMKDSESMGMKGMSMPATN